MYRYTSNENIAKAKCEITSFLRPTGLVVIPGYVPLLERQLFSQWHGRVIRVSLEDQLPLHKTNIALLNNQQLPDANLVGKVLLDDKPIRVNESLIPSASRILLIDIKIERDI